MVPLGLYLHVPFCRSICNYCNFSRGLYEPALAARYVPAVEREIAAAGNGREADTIYFGGGTPSMLEAAQIGRLIAACRSAFQVAVDAEVTLEANPETVTRERLEAYRTAGVNRLSFGVQSFLDSELLRLGRAHNAARARSAFHEARAAGYDNVSLDLMLWLPEQHAADVDCSLDAIIELAPEHVSAYLLELYPNAPLRDEMERSRWSLAPDEDAAQMYLQMLDRFEGAGYRQYEISNLARPGRTSRHNLKYWTDGEWVGFGSAAHSTVDGVRWNNMAPVLEYVQRIERGESVVAERRILTQRERVEEALFMGLRLTEGISVQAIRDRYGVDVWSEWGSALAPFVEAGLLAPGRDRLQLSRNGMLLSNEVMTAFLEAGSTVK